MDKKSVEEQENRFTELLQKPPYPVDEMIALIKGVPEGKGAEWAVSLLKALSDAPEAAPDVFESAVRLVLACCDLLGTKLQGVAVRDALRKCTKDRLRLSIVDGVGFERRERPLKDAVARLERLLSFHPDTLVLSNAWGLGTVKRLDYFYRRVTVDFEVRRGHQFTYDAACETLAPAPENHILVTRKRDPDLIAKMLADQPGAFVKEMLASFGDMPVTRLEELCAQYGFVKAGDTWKKFWERARTELRKDKCVEIPTRRAEPIHVKAEAEDYGIQWFTALSQMKDPKSILSTVREFESEGKCAGLDDGGRAKIADRLAFALKGAKKVDDALYARIAFCIAELKLDPVLAADEKLAAACTSKARAYLLETLESGEDRYLAAVRDLPAREVGRLVAFLTAEDTPENPAVRQRLIAALPKMCFTLLSETVEAFKTDVACKAAVAELLRSPAAPATLVTLILGRYESFADWLNLVCVEEKVDGKTRKRYVPQPPAEGEAGPQLPDLIVILMHAVALGEGRQGGETLRMQNTIRRLFANSAWLDGVLDMLAPGDKALLFERFQASTTWDPSTHHVIVVRMTKHAPELVARIAKKVEVKKIEHITSIRSYAERQAAYEHLVKIEIPENTRRIEFAKSYGDLSENAEYQYAKDEQRALMQKESVLQKDLNTVKAVDFSDVTDLSAVCPGSTVAIATAAGETRVYTILGEWDNDLSRGVISSKTRLAADMLGKKVGDAFDLADAEGNVSTATITSISPLTDELRAWLSERPAQD